MINIIMWFKDMGCYSNLTFLEAGFMHRKAYEIAFKSEVVQGLPLLQLLLHLIHCLLPFFNGADMHNKLLHQFDGAVGSSLS
jgi:hypothetical protein